jgi:hypothetical protein
MPAKGVSIDFRRETAAKRRRSAAACWSFAALLLLLARALPRRPARLICPSSERQKSSSAFAQIRSSCAIQAGRGEAFANLRRVSRRQRKGRRAMGIERRFSAFEAGF